MVGHMSERTGYTADGPKRVNRVGIALKFTAPGCIAAEYWILGGGRFGSGAVILLGAEAGGLRSSESDTGGSRSISVTREGCSARKRGGQADECRVTFVLTTLETSSVCRKTYRRMKSTRLPASLYEVFVGVKTEAFSSRPPPRCPVHPSHQNFWITSSIFFTTQATRSRVAASFQDHGSRALECTFSPKSGSATLGTWNHGKPCLQILPPLPRVTPKP